MIFTFLLSSQPPFWQDATWIATFVSIFLGLLSLFITVVVYIRQRERKSLSYDVISDTPIASIRKSLGNKVEIFFEREKVDELRLIVIRLWNSGNLTVKPEDYYSPIEFGFEKGKVLESEIVEEIPKEIEASITHDESHVVLKPVLLNPKDSITIRILLDGFGGKIIASGRIVNAVLVKAK